MSSKITRRLALGAGASTLAGGAMLPARAQTATRLKALRQRMAAMIQDPATFHDDANLQQVKRDIDRHSGLREQFQVYCHEFSRTPNLEFRLGLADVVYFGLAEGFWEYDGKQGKPAE